MSFYKTTETINGMSNTIGTYELFFGDYKKIFSAPDDYKKVTAEDIKKVAAKYFTKQNRTVGILNTEEKNNEQIKTKKSKNALMHGCVQNKSLSVWLNGCMQS